MLVLGIETTCDETACAVVRDGQDILSNVIASQIEIHAEFGGVVPELACRQHIDLIIPVIIEALAQANITKEQIDLIAVANCPGLIGALLIGLHTAKGLSIGLNKPFIGVNHIEAHLYAALMSQSTPPQFPCLGLVLSGGHTALLLMKAIGDYTLISQTVDDAIGEAFDKVAKILGLNYPGGPQIEELAKKGDPFKFQFKSGQVKGQPLSFSFSGLKTAVLYGAQKAPLESDKKHIAASFQQAALSDIVNKGLKAAKDYGCQTLVFGGGVTNNKRLREMFLEADSSLSYIWPASGLSLDNAAMIAGCGYHDYLKRKKQGDSFELDANSQYIFNEGQV